jgi:hypothetical protein
MNDLQRQLEQDLHAAAHDLELAPGNVHAVMSRGRARGRRQSFAALVAVAVVAATVGADALARRGGGQKVTSGGALAPTAALSGDIGLVWQKVDAHSALAYASGLTEGAGSGALYAVSTAPGLAANTNTEPAKVLYQSSDGVEWSPKGGPENAYLSDLSATGGDLYAVGTGVATVAGNSALHPLVLSDSADGGTSWRSATLPIDLAAIAASSMWTPSENVQVVSNATGVVVVAQVQDQLNVTRYLPAGVTAPNGWVVTATGVDLLGPIQGSPCPAGTTEMAQETTTSTPSGANAGPAQPTLCYRGTAAQVLQATGSPGGVTAAKAAAAKNLTPVVIAPEADHSVTHSYTWAQLGITGDVLQAAAGAPFVFFSTDGSSLRPVTLANPSANIDGIQVAAGTNEFAIEAQVSATDKGSSEAQVWTSADGATWTATPAPPADQSSPSAVGFLDGRLTLVSGTAPVVATFDGARWSEMSLASVLGALPSGTTATGTTAAIGPFGIAMVVLEVPSLHPANQAVTGNAQRTLPATEAPGPFVQRLLVSRDGTTWSNLSLTQLAGANVGSVSNLAVANNRFLVTAQGGTAPFNAGAEVPSVVLVGTAR